MFGRSKKSNGEPEPHTTGALDGNDSFTGSSFKNFQPDKTREALFKALNRRVGDATNEALKEDFYGHLADDNVHGVEKAYLCLLGKMVELIDVLHEDQPGLRDSFASRTAQEISPFAMFRKDG